MFELKPKRYPKKCPVCNSTAISRNPLYGMKCRRCGFEVRRFVKKEDLNVRSYLWEMWENL